MKNDLIIRAAIGDSVERVPVWMMRQAGRILPEYRAVRSKLSGFKELVETPELACEVTLQPVDLLGVDAAIIFSDILVIPEAMGLPYQMVKGKGPLFEKTVQSKQDIEHLHIADPEADLGYVLRAIELTKKELQNRVPLIGFAGAPWTIFAYMIEGAGSKTFSKARRMLYQEPVLSHQLLAAITESTVNYLKAQIAAGADLVQVFDSWAGILPREQYLEFSLHYIEQICNAIPTTPKTVFAKGAWFALEDQRQLKCNVVGLDWNTDPTKARAIFGEHKTLQGNLDPCLLYADEKTIINKTEKMLKQFGRNRYIANLGHGVYPDTDPEKAKLFIETVKNYEFNKN